MTVTGEFRTSLTPFTHTVLDDFFADEALDAAVRSFPSPLSPQWHTFDSEHEQAKQQLDDPESVWMSIPPIVSVLNDLMSPAFCRMLTRFTGIEDLIPDVVGGGPHQTLRGGYLNMHVDSASDFSDREWYRRINVLLYLNRLWIGEPGGDLVIATRDADGFRQHRRIAPQWNRLVIFETTGDTWHGHPDPWAYSIPRRSIAVYYYTDTAPPGFDHERRTTFTEERP